MRADQSNTFSTESSDSSLRMLVVIGFPVVLIALWAAFLYAPTERVEGNVQRILYMHVPAAMTM